VSGVALLPASGYVEMPWKNGLGRTAEIARQPREGDPFAWRLSIATIERDAPFSAFPGCDRTLVALTGEGVALEFADGETLVAHPPFGMVAFAGEREAQGRLLGGPTRDLNAITFRRLAAHRVSILALEPAGERFRPSADVSVIVCLEGALAAAAPDREYRLNPLDSLRVPKRSGILTLQPRPAATVALVEIDLRATLPT
jgi:environmental stress-induced protein Ves